MRILSIDAKDIYEANHLVNISPVGYNIRDDEGILRLSKFVNVLDYSLDLIKLRQVHVAAYRRNDFSFTVEDKEYSQQVINVTFKYSHKRYNQVTRFDTRFKENRVFYILAGYSFDELQFRDRLAFSDGQLVGVCIDAPVDVPVSQAVLGDVFYFDDDEHVYRIHQNRNETLKTRKELREDLYQNGFYCDGIKYVRFKRSSGSSRVGKCLFIDERLAGRMRIWEKCGVSLRKGQPFDLAAWEAYISLTLSSIIDTIEIRPENILLIDDYESTFEDTMLAVDLDGTWLNAAPKTTKISNCIWDGQSLLDSSMFGQYSDRGMLLLRTRFFKSACFNTNIQQYFADHGITEVSQLKGRTCATKIEDIKLITTPASIKYLKFGSFEDWLERLEPEFGIVKYDKPTHFFDGDMVQTHYQLLNTLHMSRDEVGEFLEPTHRYFDLLDTNPTVFKYHVGCQAAITGEYYTECFDTQAMNDLTYYLLGVNRDFCKTRLYDTWKSKVLKSFKDNVRKGHILVRGTYATLFGNPYEMLQASIGAFDGTSLFGSGHLYCPMFEDGAELLGSRSPHVAAGNILVATNSWHQELDTYFNLTPCIVCINSINENILERLSGADMDSDTMLLTSDELLVRKAKEHYDHFLVPTKMVPSEIKKRYYTEAAKADLDHTTADNRIGEIVNLSQELNSLMWDKLNHGAKFADVAEIYADIAKLDVLSNIEIDRAKRECVVDAVQELKRLRAKYVRVDKTHRKLKPFFFAHISRKKGYHDAKRNHYAHHDTTMDYLQDHVISWRKNRKQDGKFIPLGKIFKFPYYSESRVRPAQAEQFFSVIRSSAEEIQQLWRQYSVEDQDLVRSDILEKIDKIAKNRVNYLCDAHITNSTLYWMLLHIEDEEYRDIQQMFMKLLFGHPTKNFRRMLWIMEESVPELVRCKQGSIDLYGIKFHEFMSA